MNGMTLRKSRARRRRTSFQPESLEPRCVLDSTVVFSELMYHPPNEDVRGEWIELRNLLSVDMDLSGWALRDAVSFDFPKGTVVPADGYLIVAANPAGWDGLAPQVQVLGPWTGALSNGGETVQLYNNSQRRMDVVEYDDRLPWPVAGDGTGFTLAKLDEYWTSQDAGNWRISAGRGGTPGTRNFPEPDLTPLQTQSVSLYSPWRYDDTNRVWDQQWRVAGFDDSSWPSGPALLYAGNENAAPETGVRVVGLDENGDAGISALKTYTHALDFGTADNGAQVNEVSFTRVTKDQLTQLPNLQWANTSGIRNQGTNNKLPPLSGPLRELMQDYVMNTLNLAGGTVTLTLLGLTPGVQYQTRLYSRRLDDNPRGATISFDVQGDGTAEHTLTMDQNDPTQLPAGLADRDQPYAVEYVFQAAADRLTITIQQTVANHPWILYGLTNEAVEQTTQAAIDTLFSTGVDDQRTPLPPGSLDLHWKLKSTGAPLVAMTPHPAWLANDATSQWIGFQADGTANVPASTFTVATEFDLSGYDPSSAQLQLRIGADNTVQNVRLNGQPTGIGFSGFASLSSTFLIEQGFRTGRNTLELDLVNAGTDPNPAGLRIELQGTALAQTDRTELTLGPTTHYFRQNFNYTGDPRAQRSLQLRLLADDGAVVYLNGTEIYRRNMPDGAVNHTTSALQNVGSARLMEPVELPAQALIVGGSNVLAVEVHQAAGGHPDLRFGAELFVTEVPRPPQAMPDVRINEIAAAAAGSFWVELINAEQSPVSLSGYVLQQLGSRDQSIVLPNITLQPGTIWQVSTGPQLWTAAADDRLVLLAPDQAAVLDAQVVSDRLQGRNWEESGPWRYPSAATPGLANQFDISQAVVINEILYHAPPQFATDSQPFVESTEEWIELFNRSAQPVNLTGWRLAGGIDYAFPAGTRIEPGGYLVVARDAATLRQKYPDIAIIGNFAGQLADGDDQVQLLDAASNPVDEVHYYDDGRWPTYADGGGSSLELRDPDADNAQAEAWAASDERDAAGWVTVSYEGLGKSPPNSNDPSEWQELILGLLDAGEVLIDDVSLIEDPRGLAIERMQNGTFEQGADHWRILGNHDQSRVIVDPSDLQNHVLHVVATSATEHMHNHLETTLANGAKIQATKTYRISFRAKWLAGSPQLHSRLYFNRLAETTILPTTTQPGTPGQPNSQRQTNIGPTFHSLRHEPAVPEPSQPVTVSVSASDPDSVASARLWYAVEGGAWRSVPMQRGLDNRFAGTIPGQLFARRVQFYVEATDGQGAVSQFPAAGPNSRAMYKVNDRAATTGPRHNLRIVMTEDDLNKLFTQTNYLSNQRMGATVIWNEGQVYYDVDLRLKGSGFSRGSTATGVNMSFPRQQLLFGEHDTVAIDRQGAVWGLGASQAELTAKHIANAAGGIPMMYDDVIQLVGPRDFMNGSAQLMLARYNDVFLESQFDDGGEGTRYKFELVYYSTLTVDGNPESLKRPPGFMKPNVFPVLGVDMAYMGEDPNAYRWNFLIRNQRAQDDFSRIVALTSAMNRPGSTVGSQLDVETQAAMDVDEWMRVFAFESLTGINDTFNQGLQHNLQLYVRPEDQRVLALPWDMDFTFHQDTSMPIYGTGSRLSRVIQIPTNRRVFQQHLWDMIQTTYNEAYLRPWIEHLGAITQQNNTAALVSYVNARRAYVVSQLMPNVPFRITTNGGSPLTVTTPHVTLEGNGWINVREIRQPGATVALPVRWLDDKRWQVTVPLQAASQQIELQAYDLQGQQVGTSRIQVTTSALNSAADSLRVTEVHYNPAAPTAAELAAGWTDNDDFEFVELTNIGSAGLDLSGVRFVRDIPGGTDEGIGFNFPAGTLLVAGQSIVVTANPQAFRARYGNLAIADLPYDGQLSNGGETLTLVDAGGKLIQSFAYDDNWYPATDGSGASLQIRSPQTIALNDWSTSPAWMPSAQPGGSPGHAALPDFNADRRLDAQDIDLLYAALSSDDRRFDLDHNARVDRADVDFLVKTILQSRAGDANLDGIFNSQDLVYVFQQGEYEDQLPRNSGWADGDWNGDGEFTSADLVQAFAEGAYTAEASPNDGLQRPLRRTPAVAS